MGVEVIETGLSTTPTVEMAVKKHSAQGGIIITASHNPVQWNALKLLNEKGEFIDAAEGAEVIRLSEEMDFPFAEVENLGQVVEDSDTLEYHIQKILDLPLVVSIPRGVLQCRHCWIDWACRCKSSTASR